MSGHWHQKTSLDLESFMFGTFNDKKALLSNLMFKHKGSFRNW